MKTRDVDIRSSLHEELSYIYGNDTETLIIDELGLCQGDARVDVAVLNGSIHGYEIKSESDTLDRLPGQIDIYNRVLDKVTIITGRNHYKRVLQMVPEWWGIEVAESDQDNIVHFNPIRESISNITVDSYSIAQLLWRDEALELLSRFEMEKGFISKPRQKIWEKLAESFPQNDLKYYVREQLKTRRNWRVGLQQE